MKTIKLPCFGIEVELHGEQTVNAPTDPRTGLVGEDTVRYERGTIKSALKEPCPYCDQPNCHWDKKFNAAMDVLEQMILSCAVSGIDIGSTAFLQAIETVVDKYGNEGSE
jgi:hypothetical protein